MKRVPFAALCLLRLRIPASDREFVLGDLEERFEAKIRRHGIRAARRWYWREAFVSWLTRWNDHALEFGNSVQGDSLMQTLIQDLRWATKILRTAPAFTAAVVLTLALAIGANSTIFSWINRVLLHPIPGVETSGLYEFDMESPLGNFNLSYLDYQEYRKHATTVRIAGHDEAAMTLNVNNSVERVWGEVVTDNYFDVLGVKPQLGRGFVEDDLKPDASPVVAITYGLWQRQFAGDPSLIGRSLGVNGRMFTVVGIMPREFAGASPGLQLDIFVPISLVDTIIPGRNRLQARGNHWFQGIARLQPGVTMVQAREELNSISRGIVEIVPAYREIKTQLTPHGESTKGGVAILRPVLLAMMTVVVLILLIACSNIANLLLARATGRRREIAIRLSMGATRGRMLRQLLTEGFMLAGAGAIGGLIVTVLTSGLLNRFAPPSDLPIAMNASVDYRVVAFTLALAVVSTMLFALLPAVRLSRAGTSEAMKEGSSGAGTRNGLRMTLVVVQVSLSLALLVAAGLCIQSLRRIEAFDPGFNKDGVLLAAIDLFPAGYDSTTGPKILGQIIDGLESIPGVTSYTLARHIPLGLTGLNSSSIDVDGYVPKPNESPFMSYTPVGPNYFTVMNIPLISGRDLRRSDDAGAPPVAVVSETMAKSYWPGRDAVGGRFRFGSNSPWMTVVGVARDMKWREIKEKNRPFVFLPVLQNFHPSTVIHLRTAGDPMLLTGPVRDVVRKVAPQVPVFAFETLAGHVSAASFQQNMASRLLGSFGMLALTLAALGLYGVLAFLVGQRTREIGIRMALGAKPEDVFRMVVRHGLLLTAVGLGFGIAASFGLGQAMSGLLFGVSPSDPLTIVAGSTILVLTALAACMIPALRATRVDPVTALRSE